MEWIPKSFRELRESMGTEEGARSLLRNHQEQPYTHRPLHLWFDLGPPHGWIRRDTGDQRFTEHFIWVPGNKDGSISDKRLKRTLSRALASARAVGANALSITWPPCLPGRRKKAWVGSPDQKRITLLMRFFRRTEKHTGMMVFGVGSWPSRDQEPW
jgi:hypothetical protein